jgi:hypothetical protein
MSKVSTKLAAGLRKVKDQPAPVVPVKRAGAASARNKPAVATVAAPVRNPDQGHSTTRMHPARIWPD